MKTISKFGLLSFIACLFVACTQTKVRVIPPEESAKFGFNVSGDSVLKNPPADKARVYVVGEDVSNYYYKAVFLSFLYGLPATYTDNNGTIKITEETQKDIIEKTKSSYIGYHKWS